MARAAELNPKGAGAAPDLPAVGTSFLGRDQERRELAKLLESTRLVTITGAPGIGKSRLAIEVARQLAGWSRDGARLAELAPLADPALVPGAVAATVSIKEVAGKTIADTVIASLRRRSMVLVLDNCEHVLAACAELAEGLLLGCPELKVLATSRQALGVEGEAVWPLSPLSVPESAAESSPEDLLAYDAVRLFVERASAVQPDFGFNAYVASSVVEIARSLDGVPLAIELAAARVETFTPAEIARRLEDRFGLLRAGTRSDLSAHPTLEASLDWSHELLSPAEAALLRRLSVFRGGFVLDAAEAVCGGGDIDSRDVPDLIARLLDRSLVVADAGQARHRLLETIRAYAGERLDESGETSRLRKAHARFYVTLAEDVEPLLTGPDQVIQLERLEEERENLRAALEWSLGSGNGEWALRLSGALVLFWRVRCYFSDGRELLEAALAAGEEGPPRIRAKALWGAGFLALMSGAADGAITRTEESLSLARELGDAKGVARALLVLGNCRQYRGDQVALSLLEESATMAREADDSWCQAHALGLAAYEYGWRGELPVARALFEESLEVARGASDTQSLRLGLLGLGVIVLRQGDYAVAESLLTEGLTATDELGEDFGRGSARLYLGELAFARGDYERAQDLIAEALATIPDVGPPEVRIRSLLLSARLAHALGDRAEARRLFEEVVAQGRPVESLAWPGLGDLLADEGDIDAARQMYEDALTPARARGNKLYIADLVHALGRLSRVEANLKRAGALHSEALELRHQIGDKPGTVGSLEALAGVAAANGSPKVAASLFGAADAVRTSIGCVRQPWESSSYETDLALVRESLSEAELRAALSAGARLSLAQAVAQASQGEARGGRPSSGWSSLTESERRVATLVAEGLTNPEIAERLFISRETVKTHVSHIFAKMGVTSRRELVREPGAKDSRRSE